MKLYKRNGLYYCQYLDPTGRRVRFSCHTRLKAEATEYALEHLKKPLSHTMDVLPLSQVIQSRERSLEHSKYFKNCFRYHRQLLNYFGALLTCMNSKQQMCSSIMYFLRTHTTQRQPGTSTSWHCRLCCAMPRN